RLVDHGSRTELVRPFPRDGVTRLDEDDDAPARMLRSKPNRLKELESVGVQRRVEDEDVGLEERQLRAHLAHRAGPVHVVPVADEAVDDGFRDGGLVLGDEDSRAPRHGRASYWL